MRQRLALSHLSNTEVLEGLPLSEQGGTCVDICARALEILAPGLLHQPWNSTGDPEDHYSRLLVDKQVDLKGLCRDLDYTIEQAISRL